MRSKFTWILTLFAVLMMNFSYAQEKSISGTVSDDTGTLPGVSVVVRGTTRGTQTDMDGKYTIMAKAGEVLQFSYIGMKTFTAVVGTSNSVNVTMASEANVLDELTVLTPYRGKISKREVTGAVATVAGKEIAQLPIGSFENALQGRAAGVNVQSSSGRPGAPAVVRIRGNSSISGGSTPLYVLDGIPLAAGSYTELNANDFEGLSVVKDASGSALYGSRGANGVILVNSRKGDYNSPIVFQVSTQTGITTRTDTNFDVMSSAQLFEYQKRAGLSNTPGMTFSDAELAKFANVNTNWADVFFRNAKFNSHQLNASGGGEKVRFYSSLQYYEQEGQLMKSDLQRFTFRTNVEAKISDKFTMGSTLSIGFTKENFIQNENASNVDNPITQAYVGAPYVYPYMPDGSYDLTGVNAPFELSGFASSAYNALEGQQTVIAKQQNGRITGSIYGDLEVAKNLLASVKFGLDYNQSQTLDVIPSGTTLGDIQTGERGYHGESFGYNARFNNTTSLVYSNLFNEKHYFSLGGYVEYFKDHSRGFNFAGYGLNPKFTGYANAITPGSEDGFIPAVGGTFSEEGLFSYFGVARYTYDEKYGFEASLRRDSSSKFADANKVATFYSVSGRWNIDQEAFMQKLEFFNYLKLRASYGTAGNQGAVTAYADRSTWTTGNYAGAGTILVNSLGNPDLKWETVKQFNVGLDFAVWKNIISGSVDYYDKKTIDLLSPQLLSLTSGFSSILSNVGDLRNEGLELSLSALIVNKGDWRFEVLGNISRNKNTIVRLAQGNESIPNGYTVLEEGRLFNEFYLIDYAGVSPTDGRPLWYDADGNLTDVYSVANRTHQDKSPFPKFTGGFGFNLEYKNFDLSSMFSFATDQYRMNTPLMLLESNRLLSQGTNGSTRLLTDVWTPDNRNSVLPAYQYLDDTLLDDSTLYLEDASFLRWRNLTIGYNLPMKESKVLRGARFYGSVTNLATWTKYRGFDPEGVNQQDFFNYPASRTFTFGVDLTF